MESVRYIHAADLHLDAPFQGICQESAILPNLGRTLRHATFMALDRLFRLCSAERPDFVVLCGDIYNQENFSVRAQLELRDKCEELGSLGIPIFIAHGNHDPLTSRLRSISWPDNVSIFGEEVESRIVEKNGVPVAVVHGISHSTTREQRNLSALFRRDLDHDCFQLGVLHCTLDGQGKNDRYAPASLSDLRASGLDAWALGHVHEKCVLSHRPFVAYSGNTQGLHINECGPRGCFLVTARPDHDSFACEPVFHRLSPVVWQKLELDLSDLENLDELERRLGNELEELAASSDPDCVTIIVRLVLRGRSSLDAILRGKGTCEDLLERMRHFANATPAIWIKDIIVKTRSTIDMKEVAKREDLAGELARLAQDMRCDAGLMREIMAGSLEPLYGHARLRRALSKPDENDMSTLLDEAERLCLDLLENR